jgi:hypothetical protein
MTAPASVRDAALISVDTKTLIRLVALGLAITLIAVTYFVASEPTTDADGPWGRAYTAIVVGSAVIELALLACVVV